MRERILQAEMTAHPKTLQQANTSCQIGCEPEQRWPAKSFRAKL
jgi:hypothetical protein